MSEQKNKLLEVKDLKVSFFTPAGEVKAVGGISYDLDYGEVMGVVGESGSGKSQEAYSIMGLLQSPGKVIGGSITFEGKDVLSFSKEEMTAFRGNKVAMIFQNPMTCLNPVYTIGNQLVEALRAHDKKISKEEAQKRAMEMMELVGINNVENFICNDDAVASSESVLNPSREVQSLLNEYHRVTAELLGTFELLQNIISVFFRTVLHLTTVISKVFSWIFYITSQRHFY